MLAFAFALVSLPAVAHCSRDGFDSDSGAAKKIYEMARVNRDKASMRIDPTTSAAEVEFLSLGTSVSILRRGAKKLAIGKHVQFWYMVRTQEGLEGWVYGASLDRKGEKVRIANAGSGDSQSSSNTGAGTEEFKKILTGKWWEYRTNGSTGYRKLYFWPDGKYKYGYGSGQMREGRYEVLPATQMVLLDKHSGVGDQVALKRVGSSYRITTRGKTIYHFRKGSPDPEEKKDTTDIGKKN